MVAKQMLALIAAWAIGSAVAVSGVGCAWTRTQVHSLQQCSEADAKVITTATADIIAATADARESGQLVTSMLRIIDAMARLNAAWRNCAANDSRESMRALEGARGDVDVATLGELLGGGG
jgi:hypothetical protein